VQVQEGSQGRAGVEEKVEISKGMRASSSDRKGRRRRGNMWDSGDAIDSSWIVLDLDLKGKEPGKGIGGVIDVAPRKDPGLMRRAAWGLRGILERRGGASDGRNRPRTRPGAEGTMGACRLGVLNTPQVIQPSNLPDSFSNSVS
jgi:hypothetical protein